MEDDREIEAMAAVAGALKDLAAGQRARVLAWAQSRFGVTGRTRINKRRAHMSPSKWESIKVACDAIGKPEIKFAELKAKMMELFPGEFNPNHLSRDMARRDDHWRRVGHGLWECLWLNGTPGEKEKHERKDYM